MVGAFVLSCEACGWHYLNKNPCSVCGEKSVSSYGSDNPATGRHVRLYGCKAHPVTRQLGIDVEKLGELAKAAKPGGNPKAAGIEVTAIPFSDAIISAPVIYGEPIPFLFKTPADNPTEGT
jgi:hypothetical protein